MTSLTFHDCFDQVFGWNLWHSWTSFSKLLTRLKTPSRANWRPTAKPWESGSSSPRQTSPSWDLQLRKGISVVFQALLWNKTFSILRLSRNSHEVAARGFESNRAIPASRCVTSNHHQLYHLSFRIGYPAKETRSLEVCGLCMPPDLQL